MTIVEKSAHVLPMLSADMAAVVERRLTQHGVHVLCGQSAKSITSRDDNSLELAMGAETLPCDVLLLSVGVRPNAELAKRSGLHVGSLGGVVVDEQMVTSDPRIQAVGDVVEVKNASLALFGLLADESFARLRVVSTLPQPAPFRLVAVNTLRPHFGSFVFFRKEAARIQLPTPPSTPTTSCRTPRSLQSVREV